MMIDSELQIVEERQGKGKIDPEVWRFPCCSRRRWAGPPNLKAQGPLRTFAAQTPEDTSAPAEIHPPASFPTVPAIHCQIRWPTRARHRVSTHFKMQTRKLKHWTARKNHRHLARWIIVHAISVSNATYACGCSRLMFL